MADPYWRYAAAAPPPSSDRGSIPKPRFPGYLASDASTLTAYNPYSSSDLRGTSDFLRKDILPSHSRPEAYGINDIAGIRSEPGVSGLTAGANIKGYQSAYDDPNLLAHRRDVAPGINPGIPDANYERPSSIRRTDGVPAPAAESNILFVDQLPTDCTRREVGHLFRPFIGFRELRLVHKEPRREVGTECHQLGRIIEDCRTLLRRPWDWRIGHTLRDGNKCADALARLGHGGQRTWDEVPVDILALFEEDAM